MVTAHGCAVTAASGSGGGTRMTCCCPGSRHRDRGSCPAPALHPELPSGKIPPGVFDVTLRTAVLSSARYPRGYLRRQ
ncbi:hypothetical protein [Streptomyces sp. NPDC057403]|uniref:hypothetical protein n=1 Tax=Streptomyces sp. NPDC057403 TaxID=3346119 RepID=UPI0036C2F49E